VALQTDPSIFQSTRLDVLLRGVLMKLGKEIRESGAKVTYGVLPEVQGNPDRLMQLWENLLRNAIVHRGETAPEIEIAARQEGDLWLIVVRDHGPGIDADLLEKAFQPFERLPSPCRGSGLGLATSRAIVERHGGRIWAESEPGSGASFHFTLPV